MTRSRMTVLSTTALLLLTAVTVAAQQNGDVRLTGYKSSQRFGRLDMFLNGKWGAVCNIGFNLSAANVACRQMGLGLAMHVDNVDRIFNRFGYLPQGTPMQVMGLQCNGDETHLLNCKINPGNDICKPEKVVEMSCSNFRPQPKPGDVRLVGGSFPSHGFLEVFHNGSWRKPCTNGFGNSAAAAVCTQLGYTAGVYSFQKAQSDSQSMPGLSWKNCSSSTTCASSCIAISEEKCSDDHSIEIICSHNSTASNITMATSCTIESSQLPFGSLRLANGSSPNQGRLEILSVNYQWFTICGRDAKHFPITSGHVACRQLGFVGVETMHSMSTGLFGTGGPMGVHRMLCKGGEESVHQCNPTDEVGTDCTDLDAVGLTCISGFGSLPYGAITLKGSGGASGSLSVYNGTEYGPVCDYPFSQTEADVACRQLGYEKARSMVRASYFHSNMSAILSNISCQEARDSSSLLSCPHTREASCTEGEHIGLHCLANDSADDPSNNIRLIEGNGTAGIVEVLVEGQWRTVCSTEFKSAALVACLQLGFYGAYSYNATTKNGSGDMSGFYFGDCRGHEDRLDDCQHFPVFPTFCSQSVSVSCKNQSDHPFGTLRLFKSSSESGRLLEVFNFDRWGQVCYTSFDNKAASVACRELGYVKEQSVKSITVTDLPVYNIRRIYCTGNESHLIDCPHDLDGWCTSAVALECSNVTIPGTTKATASAPITPPLNNAVGIGVGTALSVFLLFLVAILIVLITLMVRRCLRRRKREAEESDWMPNTSKNVDMSFHNPRFEEPAAAPARGVSSSPPQAE